MPKQKCLRCGKCCNHMFLPFTPDQLWEGYKNWLHSKSNGWKPDEVYLIAPMLRLIRKAGNGGYYRCLHLEMNSNNKATCGIYEYRPEMCKGYPIYHLSNTIRIGERSKNYGRMGGCGFAQEKI